MKLEIVKKVTYIFFALCLVACGGSSSSSSSEPDTDGDGFVDNIDMFPLDSTETIDTDLDGVGDNSDEYPNNPAESRDSDKDGLADNADPFPSDPAEKIDTDNDGIGNKSDNCFLLANPAQKDSNQDGIGDACAYNDTGMVFPVEQEGIAGTNDHTLEDIRDPSFSENLCIAVDGIPSDQQDCFYGRDALFIQGNLTKVGSGLKGFDLTKLDEDGNELSFDVENPACIRDNVTGLVWEIKDDTRPLHSTNNIILFEDALVSESSDETDCSFYNPESEVYCNSNSYVKILNEISYCGQDSWGLPNYHQAINIRNQGDGYSQYGNVLEGIRPAVPSNKVQISYGDLNEDVDQFYFILPYKNTSRRALDANINGSFVSVTQ